MMLQTVPLLVTVSAQLGVPVRAETYPWNLIRPVPA